MSDWRTRAVPVNANYGQPVQLQGASDERDYLTQLTEPLPQQPTVTPTQPAAQGNWRTRAEAVQPVKGTDMGAPAAAVQGFNSTVPFGERIAAGLGAGGAYAYDKLSGLDSGTSIGDYYDEARANQEVTAENNKGAYVGGALTGVAATLPMASAKVLTGTKATTGVRGAINEIPEMLSSAGNWVRGSKVAADAGTVAKAANLTGKAVRSAALAAPAGAVYSYGASKNDLTSPEAVQDAVSGAKLAAGVGAAVPVVGAALNKVVKPVIDDSIKALAQRAKDAFGIDLSLDQIAPSTVRDTVQKVSQTIPGSGVEAFQGKQQQQWMRAVAKEIGQDSDNLGPETIQKFLDDASTKFEAIVQHSDIKFNSKPLNALQRISAEAKDNITKDYSDIVATKANGLVSQLFKARNVPSGVEYTAKQLNGKKLASIRSQLVKSLPNVAGDARQYVSEMVDVIDDIAKKNLASEDIKKLEVARKEWRNFKTIEPLLEKSTDGTINPTQLLQRVASSKYIKASRKKLGEDNLVDLARIGKQFMGKKGGSDTAQKLAYMKGGADIATGLATLAAPLKVIPALAANRGYQAMVNQSPSVVRRAVTGTSTNAAALPIADMLAAGATQRITGK